MIKTDEAKIILNIVAVSVVVTIAVCGMAFSSGADDSPTNRTANPLSTNTIYVPDDCETIQEAVDNASSGDMIIVREGVYNENVDVNVTNLTIRSENGSASCIVNATDPNDHVFNVTANCVDISGFTVTGATGNWLGGRNKAGICLYGAEHCNISDNSASNNYIGIYLYYTDNNSLFNNNASNNSQGIWLESSSDNSLVNNTASNNSYGIDLYYSGNNNFTGNTMSGNGYNFNVYGTSLLHYTQSIDKNNTVEGKPIYYWVDQQNLQVPSDAGFVGIVDSMNITVRDLTLTNNGYGVLFAYTNNSTIENVTALNNHRGLYLYNSSNNLIFHNNLMDTINNAYDTNPAKNDWYHPVLLEGNYWCDYTGLDDGSGTGKHALAGDGIGDTDIPHPAEDHDFYPFINESLWNNANVSMETATGTGTVTLSISRGYFSCVSTVNESSLPLEGKPDIIFPHGFFSFNISGLDYEETVNVTIELPNNLSLDSQYWKYGANGSTINPQPERWYQIPMGSNDGDNIITVQLTDGGGGDDDGIANGVIVDQGGPALMPDLTLNFSDITFSPARPEEDDSVIITATVYNVGAADANNFTVSFFDGASFIGNDTTSVSVNSTSTTSIIWSAVSGDHNIRVVADSGNVIVESDETNNEASRAITVKKKTVPGGGGGGAPTDSDGDGYSDIDELLAGTDPNDPCDPDPNSVACLAAKPAATPTPIPATPKPTYLSQEDVNEICKNLSIGKIICYPPKEMKVGETELVEVRITLNMTEDLTRELEERGVHRIEKEIPVSSEMEVYLTGDNFGIVLQNGVRELGIKSDEYTGWKFKVTPLKSGIQTLHLTVYAVISLQGYDDIKVKEEEGPWDIEVKVNPLYTIGRAIESYGLEILIASGAIGYIAKKLFRRLERRSRSPGEERKKFDLE